MSGRVLVLGSINVDLVVTAPRLPAPGETVLGGRLERHPGGKGANQAVAAARAGASVVMLGAAGGDAEGELSLDALRGDGVDVAHVARVDGPSGMAIIAVRPDGENQIVVAPGANSLLDPQLVSRALHELAPTPPDVLLISLEVPMATVRDAVLAARRSGLNVVLNPAPATELPGEVLAAGPILTPNRAELAQLTGAQDLGEAAASLRGRGAEAVVVTLGAQGSAVFAAEGRTYLPGHPVQPVVDTTGAGDTFSGVLAAWLARERPLPDAARAANLAAALSIRSAGARTGMPTQAQILAALAG